MNNSIKKILISEKSFQDAASGKYTFIVDKKIDKETIAKAVKELFGVTVLSVNSMNYKGKIKSVKRVTGRRNDFKKVVLTLKSGDKIDLFEIASEEKAEEKAPKEVKAKKTAKKKEKAEENKDVEVTIKSK